MNIPEEAKLTTEELLALADMRSTSLGDLGHLHLIAMAQLAKAAPILEAQARKEERERIRKALSPCLGGILLSTDLTEALKEGKP